MLAAGARIVVAPGSAVTVAGDQCAARHAGPGTFRVAGGCILESIDADATTAPAADAARIASDYDVAELIIAAIDPRGLIPVGR